MRFQKCQAADLWCTHSRHDCGLAAGILSRLLALQAKPSTSIGDVAYSVDLQVQRCPNAFVAHSVTCFLS